MTITALARESKSTLQTFKELSHGGKSHQLVPKIARSNRDEGITGMRPKNIHPSCGLAPVMQATSRRRAYFANRMCCRNPTVLGDQPGHLSSAAVNNQQKTSGTVMQHLARILNGFGSKKPITSEKDSPASIVRETVKGFRCKSIVNMLGASEC